MDEENARKIWIRKVKAKNHSYKYNHSLKGRKSRKRYNQSPKGKIAQRKAGRNWRQKSKNKKRSAILLRNWRRTAKGKESLYKYNNSLSGRKSHLRYDHSLKSRYKKLIRRFKKLHAAGKIGACITIAEYRDKLFYKNRKARFCYYCLGEINKTGSGIDRKDNKINYTLSNSVACCRGCNSWKSNDKSCIETRRHFMPLRKVHQEHGRDGI